jgi:hypothetical protein
LIEIAGDAGRHPSHILPASASWAAVAGWLEARRDATRSGSGACATAVGAPEPRTEEDF